MCKEQKQTSETVQEVPEWLESGSKLALEKATDLSAKPFEAYTGDRVANLTDDQSNIFKQLTQTIGNYENLNPEIQEGIRKYMTAPAQNIGTERVVDEGGRLGNISDYLNPYQGALDDTIKRMQDAADRQRVQIGKAAVGSGAKNDARHAIAGSLSREDETRAIGEAANKFNLNRYDNAMNLRQQDVGRFYNTDVTNANLEETALGRSRQGASDLQQQHTAQLNDLGKMLNLGELERGITQQELDSAYEVYLREYADSYDSVSALTAALGRLPYTRKGTTTETKPDNSLIQLAGGLAGAALAPATGGMSLGMLGGMGGSRGPTGIPASQYSNTLPWAPNYRTA